jgi:hypothetical protein
MNRPRTGAGDYWEEVTVLCSVEPASERAT